MATVPFPIGGLKAQASDNASVSGCTLHGGSRYETDRKKYDILRGQRFGRAV
jgi:hypothetical protein